MDTVENTKKKHTLKGADKKEAFHREAESRIQPFKFASPAKAQDERKVFYWLGATDILRGSIQVVPQGGDNNLHYHPGADGFWMALSGKVRFYGPDGVIGEYGPQEGVMIPRNARYWFETADESQDLHLLHISAHTEKKPANSRVNVDPEKPGYTNSIKVGYPVGKGGGD
jgi:mannose-6-phosphate isomerase-like protein (cupin superfamily)